MWPKLKKPRTGERVTEKKSAQAKGPLPIRLRKNQKSAPSASAAITYPHPAGSDTLTSQFGYITGQIDRPQKFANVEPESVSRYKHPLGNRVVKRNISALIKRHVPKRDGKPHEEKGECPQQIRPHNASHGATTAGSKAPQEA